MPDREKTIKDIEECLSASCRGFKPRESCPYNDEEWDIMRDALALLKEQEAVEPDTDSEGTCTCSNCGETVGYFPAGCSATLKFYKFCPVCGRLVKWK